MGSGVEGITQSGVSTPKALPKIPVLKIHSLPTIHCYYYLDISSNIPALSGLYVLRSRFLKALTLSIFPYHVLSTHWWICSMHTLLGDGWITISAEGLRMDPNKIKVILQWPDLTSDSDVLSFLGLV